MPDGLFARVEELSRRTGSTLFMTMLAAFATVLLRNSGQHDIAVGVPVANRPQRATEGLVGTFVNTLVFRIDLSGNPSFLELLECVRGVALDAFAHPTGWFRKSDSATTPAVHRSCKPCSMSLTPRCTALNSKGLRGNPCCWTAREPNSS
jgi:hypothetical protein